MCVIPLQPKIELKILSSVELELRLGFEILNRAQAKYHLNSNCLQL